MNAVDSEPNRKRLLLIEDDISLCELMEDFFEGNGFVLEAAYDGPSGLAAAVGNRFDLILLDVMIPVIDGFEVLRQLRGRVTTPVIMLTARTEKADRINGLELGADDYLPKPFDPQELLARIRAVLRRVGEVPVRNTRRFATGPLSIDAQGRQAWWTGPFDQEDPLELTSIEFDILQLLARAAPRIVSRDEITAVLHHREATPFERSLDVHISHLRKKLDRNNGVAIRTVRGVGYLLAVGGEAQ